MRYIFNLYTIIAFTLGVFLSAWVMSFFGGLKKKVA